jgi:hypothetical protein
MKFITEASLRAHFLVEKPETYMLEKEQRLTPAARQFLMDRKIKIIDTSKQKSKATTKLTQQEPEDLAQMRLLQAECLKTGGDFLDSDEAFATECFAMSRALEAVMVNDPPRDTDAENQKVAACTISDLQLHLPKGKQIIAMNLLLQKLRVLKPQLSGQYGASLQALESKMLTVIAKLSGGLT